MSPELEEAAKTDGATPTQIFRYIILPQLAPVIALIAVLRFIFTFNSFDEIYLLTGGGAGHRGARHAGLLVPDGAQRRRRRGRGGDGHGRASCSSSCSFYAKFFGGEEERT